MTYELITWLLHFKGIGKQKVRTILEEVEDSELLWNGGIEDLKPYEDLFHLKARAIIQTRDKIKYKDAFSEQKKHANAIVTWLDDQYPQSLRNLTDPPVILYAKGNLSLLDESIRKIGIVGTRMPSDYGRVQTGVMTAALSKAGAVIVSGLAMGIDACAHKSALQNDAGTIAVLGCGVDQIYPKHNSSLYKEIAEKGLLLSEYKCGTEPRACHFPERNRIIAGLSEAILVMEASKKSGSLITAEMAMDQGISVFALPGPVHSSKSLGCNLLIHSGAIPIISEKDMLHDLSFSSFNRRNFYKTTLESRIIKALEAHGPMGTDEIMALLTCEFSELIIALFELETSKSIELLNGQYTSILPI